MSPILLLSAFTHLTALQNKSRPGGEYFVYEREEIISFSRLSGKATEKLFSYKQPLNGKMEKVKKNKLRK